MNSDALTGLYLVVGLACLLTGISKGGLGGSLGFLITPLVALVLPLRTAIGLVLPLLMIGDVFAVAAYWRKWDLRKTWILLGGALVGVTIGALALVSFPPLWLKRGLGVLAVTFSLYRLFEGRIVKRLRYQTRPWHGLLAGSTAGFTSTLAHAGGPPITIYLLLQRLEPAVYVATSAIFFTVLNWLKVPYYYATGMFDFPLMRQVIWLTPLIPVGVWFGRWLVRRVNRAAFEQVISVLLLISGLIFLFQ